MLSEGNSHGGGGGATNCIPFHSVHYYKGNLLQFDNNWGASTPKPHASDRPVYDQQSDMDRLVWGEESNKLAK